MQNEDMVASSSDSPKDTEQDSNDFVPLGTLSNNNRYKLLMRLAVALFQASLLLLVFFAGMFVYHSRVFPYSEVSSAYKTLIVALETNGLIAPPPPDNKYYGTITSNDATGVDASESDVFRPYGCVLIEDSVRNSIRRDFRRAHCEDLYTSKEDISTSRFEFIEGNGFAAPILVQAGRGAFRDLCPGEHGCLAVEYSSSGEVLHAYPYRPEEIDAANIVSESEFPYEHPIGWSFDKDVEAVSVSRYPNRDLMVVFVFYDSSPYGGGVARVSPDGSPLWYRKDYSHHLPYLLDDSVAVVPSFGADREYNFAFDGGNPFHRLQRILQCDGYFLDDHLSFIDGNGNLLNEVSILDAIAESIYAEHLTKYTEDNCDPTHLNSVYVLGENIPSIGDIKPGDMVFSMRRLNAFGVLDGENHHLKRVVRGSFLAQHSVQHLDGSRFIMFDNSGTDGVHGPSRLLIVDLADGQETTVFPNDDTPQHLLNFFAPSRGQIDVSPDRRRALVTDVDNGRGLEIRLSDGAVMNIFHSLHDVSGLEQFPNEHAANAWRFKMQDINYVK